MLGAAIPYLSQSGWGTEPGPLRPDARIERISNSGR